MDNILCKRERYTNTKTLSLPHHQPKNEDFDLAASLKESQSRITSVAQVLGLVEDQKNLAVAEEDYEKAKSLKGELDKARGDMREVIDDVMKGFEDMGVNLRPPPVVEGGWGKRKGGWGRIYNIMKGWTATRR